jgi:hypothetical protein
MFIDLAGSVYSAKLDGSEKRTLLAAQGNLTGTHTRNERRERRGVLRRTRTTSG